MEKAGDRAVRVAADDEDRIVVVETKQSVERHDEAAFRMWATPGTCEFLELTTEGRPDLAGPQHTRRVTGALEPVDGLAQLPDRTPAERERRSVDDSLVAVVTRMQSVRTVDTERGFRCVADRNPPVACPRELQERTNQRGETFRRSDRIAGHDRDTPDDLVGHERGLLVVEEIGLVSSQDEGGKCIDAPGGDQVPRQPAMPDLLCVAIAPRRQPADEQEAAGADREHQKRERKPLAERTGQMVRSGCVRTDRPKPRLA